MTSSASLSGLEQYSGKTIIVKFGGNAMVTSELQRAFAEDMVDLRGAGILPVVVHGGGPQVSAMLARLGIENEFRGGYRVTSPEAMRVVRMVLSGTVNREIVAHINECEPLAVAVSGEDAGLFQGRKRDTIINGQPVDLGLVGDIVSVDPAVIDTQLKAGWIPVVSSIAPDVDVPGQVLNINADAAAAALAVAVGATELVILTDVTGLYSDWPRQDSLLSVVTSQFVAGLLPTLEEGMIPKATACCDAVRGGVSKTAIIDGRVPHSIIRHLLTPGGIGTEIVPEEKNAD